MEKQVLRDYTRGPGDESESIQKSGLTWIVVNPLTRGIFWLYHSRHKFHNVVTTLKISLTVRKTL